MCFLLGGLLPREPRPRRARSASRWPRRSDSGRDASWRSSRSASASACSCESGIEESAEPCRCRRCCCSRWSRTRSSTASPRCSRGATVRSRRGVDGGRFELAVENPCDPDARRRRAAPASGSTTCGPASPPCSAREPARGRGDARTAFRVAECWLPVEAGRRAEAEGERMRVADGRRRAARPGGLLASYLAEIPGVEIVAECANGFEAVKRCAELGPDLLFLDIQMPKLSTASRCWSCWASRRRRSSSSPPTTSTRSGRSRSTPSTTCSSRSSPSAWPRRSRECASALRAPRPTATARRPRLAISPPRRGPPGVRSNAS